jgi:ABC-type transport system involved in multi-copper enzyme maturation permease subunit
MGGSVNPGSSFSEGLANPAIQPIRCRSAWGNLIRKECLDSREAVIGGVAIFWVVPIVLELVEFWLMDRRDVFPLALWLLIGAGWLYAIIVGAHTVCRDWGKAEERFLLAQPVSTRAVVWAKLIAGTAVVVVVLGVALAWDVIMVQLPAGTFGEPEMPFGEPEMLMILSVTWAVAVGFAAAFAVSVMTRQMLAGTVVAVLVLLVWAIAPLLSSHLARFEVPALLSHPGRNAAVPFVLLAFLMVAACVCVSVYYSARERVFQLGNKQLAWTACLVMLALFGGAMNEVGNSLRVRDQARLPVSATPPVWGLSWTIRRGDRFAMAYPDYRPSSQGETGCISVAAFSVSDDGHIQNMRRTLLPDTFSPITLALPPPGSIHDKLTGFAVDENGHIIVTGERERKGNARQVWELAALWRTTLSWPEGRGPEVLAHAELALPPGQQFCSPYSWYSAWRANGDRPLRYAYLVSLAASPSDRTTGLREDKLYVFDWSDGANPGPRYIIPLPQGDPDVSCMNGVSVMNGKVHVWTAHGRFRDHDQHFLSADFDANHPESLPENQNWPLQESHKRRSDEWIRQFERFGGEHIDVHDVEQQGDIAYVSDWLGLRVARQKRAGMWEIIGECRASPLTMLFRSDPRPEAFDKSLLIERTFAGMITYDVADPSNPKRTGFFNAVVWSRLDSEIFSSGQYIVLRESDLITVLDRPGRRKS